MAEYAVEGLKPEGFQNNEISVLFPHGHGLTQHVHVKSTKALDGAEVGAGAGAIVGGVLGWLAGAGMLAIPGIVAVVAAGPIATALVAAGALGGIGGLWGGLIGLGIPEKEAKHYEGRLHKGDILLSVHCSEEARMTHANEILLRTRAEDVFFHRGSALTVHAI